MNNIKTINKEISKKSTGVFKDKRGVIHYLFKGKRHRIDGPAVVSISGYKSWFFKGIRHRSDGPAVEYADGNKEWLYYGEYAESEEEFWNHEWRTRQEIERFL